jgi:hypothetical protein
MSWPMEQPADDETHQQLAPCEPLDIEGDMADVATGQIDRVRSRQVDGDFGAGIAGAHEEHCPLGKLGGVAVFVRVHLDDFSRELAE